MILFQSEGEEKVYTRDFSEPTLDDHFDKAVLPKVMQVTKHVTVLLFLWHRRDKVQINRQNLN